MIEVVIFVLGIIVGCGLGAFGYSLYSKARIVSLEIQIDHDEEKLEWIRNAQENLRESFEALASRALRDNAQDYSGRIDQQLNTHSAHINTIKGSFDTSITQLDAHIRELESKREGAYRHLHNNVINLERAQIELAKLTFQLANALSSGPVRGSWGEIQLRKIIELSGLTEHVSFNEQVAGMSGRPDLVVHLPNQGQMSIDSKFPFEEYRAAMNTTDDDLRKRSLLEYSKSVKQNILELSKKCYWEQCQPGPEIVIMFIPIEACLMHAYETDPTVIDFALEKKVILASPITLLGYLKSIAFGWQQFTISKNAAIILEQGRELFKRTSKWLDHLKSLGGKLEGAVEAYNASVSSLQTKFFPAARRFQELAAIQDKATEVELIDVGFKLPPKADLFES